MTPTEELFSEALDAGMREQAERLQLPPLSWSVRDRGLHGAVLVGQASRGDYAEDAVEGVLRSWAWHLGLDQMPELEGNTAAYRGTVDGIPVEVWGVIDDEAWEAAVTERIERYRREHEGT